MGLMCSQFGEVWYNSDFGINAFYRLFPGPWCEPTLTAFQLIRVTKI